MGRGWVAEGGWCVMEKANHTTPRLRVGHGHTQEDAGPG